MRKLILFALAMLVVPQITLADVDKQPSTLFEYYNGKLPSISERASTAAKYAIFNYTGTREQNILLLSRLVGPTFSGDNVGFSVVTDYQTTLSASMTSTQTTVPVSSVTTKDSHTLTMTDLGSEVYLTIEPGASKEELVVCTGISGTSWTGCTRGLAFYGTATSSVTANKKSHNAGSTIVMSNTHYIYENLVDKDTNQTLAGVITFTQSPIVPTPTSGQTTAAASVAYVNSVTTSGAPNATITVKGISELATKAESTAGTAAGGTSAALVVPNSSVSAVSTATATIPITEADGDLNADFIGQDQNYTWSGTSKFTGSLQASSTILSSGTNTFYGTSTFSKAPVISADPVSSTGAVRKSYGDAEYFTEHYSNMGTLTTCASGGGCNFQDTFTHGKTKTPDVVRIFYYGSAGIISCSGEGYVSSGGYLSVSLCSDGTTSFDPEQTTTYAAAMKGTDVTATSTISSTQVKIGWTLPNLWTVGYMVEFWNY